MMLSDSGMTASQPESRADGCNEGGNMYNKVVIPLDGSKLAEEALPHLEVIAKGCSIPEIMLVSVTERVKGTILQSQAFETPAGKSEAGIPLSGSVQGGLVISTYKASSQQVPLTLGRMARTAYNYLAKIAKKLEKQGFRVCVNILVGNPAEEIVRFVEQQKADLIVMASRGKSGISRWDMGNIAEKVIRATNTNVMLVKPGAGFKETKRKRKGVAS